MTIDLFAGIPVRDYNAAVTWYERLLGAAPSFLPDDTEAVWELADHRYVYIDVRPEHAGHAMHTLFVGDFDARISQIAERGLERRSATRPAYFRRFRVSICGRPVRRTSMTDTTTEPFSTRNLDRYGSAELPWSRPRDILASDTPHADLTFFVATMRPDGRPHSAGVGATWVDDALYFTSGPGTLKSRNLAVNPACSVSVRLRGVDLVLEGEARRVTDSSTLERVAAVYRTGGWPASVEGDALTAPYSAPSAGPAPWHLYRLTLHTAVGVATAERYGATRWDFAY